MVDPVIYEYGLISSLNVGSVVIFLPGMSLAVSILRQ